MPEPYRSWGLAGRGRDSSPRGLRVRLGERSGEEERPSGMGESEMCSERCITVGSDWARAIRGALSALDPLYERRWEREYGDRLRGCGWKVAMVSVGGSIWARGVIGRCERVLASGRLMMVVVVVVVGVVVGVVVVVDLPMLFESCRRPSAVCLVEERSVEVDMPCRRSSRSASVAAAGDEGSFAAVMTASNEYSYYALS